MASSGNLRSEADHLGSAAARAGICADSVLRGPFKATRVTWTTKGLRRGAGSTFSRSALPGSEGAPPAGRGARRLPRLRAPLPDAPRRGAAVQLERTTRGRERQAFVGLRVARCPNIWQLYEISRHGITIMPPALHSGLWSSTQAIGPALKSRGGGAIFPVGWWRFQ